MYVFNRYGLILYYTCCKKCKRCLFFSKNANSKLQMCTCFFVWLVIRLANQCISLKKWMIAGRFKDHFVALFFVRSEYLICGWHFWIFRCFCCFLSKKLQTLCFLISQFLLQTGKTIELPTNTTNILPVLFGQKAGRITKQLRVHTIFQ